MTTRLCRLFWIRQQGFRLRFYRSNLLYVLWKNPHDRDDDVEFFNAFLCKGDVVVDVGANIGNLAIAASIAVGPEGAVYAIEGHPRTFRYLEGNIRLNRAGNIRSYNAAIGARDGVAVLSDKHCDDQNAIIGAGPGVVVPIRRLDSLLQLGNIDLLKIDVEGYELFVLQGAEKILEGTECIYCELSEDNFRNHGYTSRDVIGFLKVHGFEIYKIEERQLLPVFDDFVAESLVNVIALKSIAAFMKRQVVNGRHLLDDGFCNN
jgi:FkbM family methyltransferase